MELKRERLLESVVDLRLNEANIEESGISDKAADYHQNEFNQINYLENQEIDKMDIEKLSKNV